LSCLCLLLAAGCGPAPPAATGSRAKLDRFEFRVDELSDLAAYLADVDRGRLRVAPPVDWHTAARAQDYLVRFVLYPGLDNPLPRITVEARDSEAAPAADREATLHQLEGMATAVEQSEPQAHDIGLLILGEVPCLRYIVPRTFRAGERSYRGEREVLITLANRRVYSVTLDVYAGKLDDYRADAFAVMAGLKFLQPQTEAAGEPAAEAESETKQEADGARPATADH
jgi:hypothetical protein